MLLRLLLNSLLLYILHTYTPQYLSIFGGLPAFLLLGALLTALNALVRPLLSLITLPARLFFTLPTIILSNLAFLWIVQDISLNIDPDLAAIAVTGGMRGWLVVSSALGVSTMVMGWRKR